MSVYIKNNLDRDLCVELVQEIADSEICWSDWPSDYIQWTEDITRKARKALGLKDE